MKKTRTKLFTLILVAIIAFTGCASTDLASTIAKASGKNITVESAEKQSVLQCTIGTAEKYVTNELKLSVSGSGYGAYRDALVAAQILLPTELTDTTKSIKKGELALLASRIMTYKGEKEDSDLSEIIVSKKRISDLSKMNEPYKACAVRVFGEGVMVGSSNGTYSQDRKFNASETVTAEAMKSAILKALGEKDRSIMSPDGQLTRTTNLPKNYKKYSYILASFPNKYYEMKNMHEITTYYYTPVNMKDYAYPMDLFKLKYSTGRETLAFKDMYDTYGKMWLDNLKNNLECRLNFNYKTVDNDWITELRETYYTYKVGSEEEQKELNAKETDAIKSYVAKAKKNKVIVKADKIVIEPSSMYMKKGTFYVRCYLRFKINATEVYNKNEAQAELIYSSWHNIYLQTLKKNQWYEGYYDIGISGTAFGDSGYGFSITDDVLADIESK